MADVPNLNVKAQAVTQPAEQAPVTRADGRVVVSLELERRRRERQAQRSARKFTVGLSSMAAERSEGLRIVNYAIDPDLVGEISDALSNPAIAIAGNAQTREIIDPIAALSEKTYLWLRLSDCIVYYTLDEKTHSVEIQIIFRDPEDPQDPNQRRSPSLVEKSYLNLIGWARRHRPRRAAVGILLFVAGFITCWSFDEWTPLSVNAPLLSTSLEEFRNFSNETRQIQDASIATGYPVVTVGFESRWAALSEASGGHREKSILGIDANMRAGDEGVFAFSSRTEHGQRIAMPVEATKYHANRNDRALAISAHKRGHERSAKGAVHHLIRREKEQSDLTTPNILHYAAERPNAEIAPVLRAVLKVDLQSHPPYSPTASGQ